MSMKIVLQIDCWVCNWKNW